MRGWVKGVVGPEKDRETERKTKREGERDTETRE